MGHDSLDVRLIALPVQVIETNTGAVIKRGNREIAIPSRAAVAVLRTIFSAASNAAVSRGELLELFSPAHRVAINELIRELLAHRLLVHEKEYGSPPSGPETSTEIFYWHYALRESTVMESLKNRRIAVMGVNTISREFVTKATISGLVNIEIIDCPSLRNLRLFNDAGNLNEEQWPSHVQPLAFEKWANSASPWDCLVATSDIGDLEIIHDLNQFCVQHKAPFLPIILNNVVGHIGPLVIPGEGPCFECLQARWNSHLENPDVAKAVTALAFQGQTVTGLHPIMASVLADIAAFELIKFFAELPGYKVGALIEVNLMASQMLARKILKIPGCMVCSRAMNKPSITPHKNVFAESFDE
jgi:bacteriocin biosynthesis cyclodehydratase domain-containing protein